MNPNSTLLLGQARGAAICAAATAGMPVAEYTALQIKQATVGYGRATKEQVQAMVVRLLSLPGTPSQDAADALACASCHANADRLASALVAGSLASAGAPLAIARQLMQQGWLLPGSRRTPSSSSGAQQQLGKDLI